MITSTMYSLKPAAIHFNGNENWALFLSKRKKELNQWQINNWKYAGSAKVSVKDIESADSFAALRFKYTVNTAIYFDIILPKKLNHINTDDQSSSIGINKKNEARWNVLKTTINNFLQEKTSEQLKEQSITDHQTLGLNKDALQHPIIIPTIQNWIDTFEAANS